MYISRATNICLVEKIVKGKVICAVVDVVFYNLVDCQLT